MSEQQAFDSLTTKTGYIHVWNVGDQNCSHLIGRETKDKVFSMQKPMDVCRIQSNFECPMCHYYASKYTTDWIKDDGKYAI